MGPQKNNGGIQLQDAELLACFLALARIFVRYFGEGFSTSTRLCVIAIFITDGLTMGALAEATGLPLYTASKCARTLELAGLVERVRSPKNARAVHIRLTHHGHKIRTEVIRRCNRTVAKTQVRR